MRRLATLVTLSLCWLWCAGAAALDLYLQVVDDRDGAPIENARIHLEPPGLEMVTDGLGMASVPDLRTGGHRISVEHPHFEGFTKTYDLREDPERIRIRLATASDTDSMPTTEFPIEVYVGCAVSQIGLSAATVRIRRWSEDPTPGQAPDSEFTLVTDATGRTSLTDAAPGFYEFDFSRTHWQPYTYGAPERVRIEGPTLVGVGLKPEYFTLAPVAVGVDPATEMLTSQALGDVLVEITGVDPADPDRVLVTPRGDLTLDGEARFENLPAIAWKVRAQKPGYETTEVLVTPEQLVAGQHIQLLMELSPTVIEVDVKRDRFPLGAADGLVEVFGVPGTTAEGVYEKAYVSYDEASDRAFARLERLLPGTYEVVYSRAQGVSVAMAAVTTRAFVYAAQGKTTTHAFEIGVDPVLIRGRLRLVDELAPSRDEGLASATSRKFRTPGRELTIVFKPDAARDGLLDDVPDHTAVVGVDGRFAILVPPGHYGIEVPDLTGYTGWDMRVDTRPLSGNRSELSTYWPYVDWPYPQRSPYFRESHPFQSDADYELDLTAHRNFVEIVGSFRPPGDVADRWRDFDSALWMRQDSLVDIGGGVFVPHFTYETAPYTILDHDPGQILAGSLGAAQGTLADFRFPDVPSGPHVLGVAHTMLELPTPFAFEVPSWSDHPGAPPASDPTSPGWLAPGLRWNVGESDLEWPEDPGQTVTVRYFVPMGAGYVETSSSSLARFTVLGQYPGVAWATATVPLGTTATIYVANTTFPAKWYRFDGVVPGGTVEVYEGGSSPTPESSGPLVADAYELTVEAFNEATGEPVSVAVDLGFTVVTTPRTVTVPYGTSETYTIQGTDWLRSGTIEVRQTSVAPPRRLARIPLEGALSVSGVLRDADGNSLGNAPVRLRNNQGQLLATVVTDATGAFAAAIRKQTFWTDVAIDGFYPDRREVAPADAGAVNLTLDPIEPPVVRVAQMDRYGLFLPGVRLALEPSLGTVESQSTKEVLTLTWRVEADAQPFSYLVDPFPHENGSQTVDGVDYIQEVVLLDPRIFRGPANDPEAPAFEALELPEVMRLADYLALRRDLVRGVDREGRPFHVVHSFGRGHPDNTFEGTLDLADLPAGPFEPLVIVATRRGGVRVVPMPPVGPKLNGAVLRGWQATLLNILGAGANLGKLSGADDDADDVADEAATRKQWPQGGTFEPSAALVGTIQADADPSGSFSYVNYKYGLEVTAEKSAEMPQSGLAALMTREVGVTVKGAVEWESSGKDSTTSMSFAGGLGDLRKSTISKYASLAGGPLKVLEFDNATSVEGKASDVQRVGEQSVFPDYQQTIALSMSSKSTARIRASFLLSTVAPLAAILRVLETFGVGVYLRYDVGVGGEYAHKHTLTRPRVGGTSTGGLPEVDVLGTAGPPANEAKLTLKFSLGGGLEARAVGSTGYLRLQLGGQGAEESVAFELNLTGGWPFLERIKGALSAVGEFSLNLAFVSVERQLKVDALPFDVQFGTEPVGAASSFTRETLVRTPHDAAPSEFVGEDGITVANAYPAGGMDDDHGLAFVAVDAAAGVSSVLFAPRDAQGRLQAPTAVVTAPATPGVAVARLGDGEWLVAWVEIAAEDVGSPFASSIVRAVTGRPGNWSTPQDVAELEGLATDLDAVGGNGDAVLTWRVGQAHALSPSARLDAVALDGSFTQVDALLRDAIVLDSAAIRTADGPLVVAAVHEEGLRSFFDELEPLELPEIKAVALATDGEGTAFAAVSEASGGFHLYRREARAWQPVATIDPYAAPRELVLVWTGDAFAVVGLEAQLEGDGIVHSVVGPDGEVRAPLTAISINPDAPYSRLSGSPHDDGVIVSVFQHVGPAAHVVELVVPNDGPAALPVEPPEVDPTVATDLVDDGDEDERARGCGCAAVDGTTVPIAALLLGSLPLRRRRRRSRRASA